MRQMSKEFGFKENLVELEKKSKLGRLKDGKGERGKGKWERGKGKRPYQEAVGEGGGGSEAEEKGQNEGKAKSEGIQEEVQSDQGTQEYEAIQGEEEIQADEEVDRGTEAAGEGVEPDTLSHTTPANSTSNVAKKTADQKKRRKCASRFNTVNDSPEVVELGSRSAKDVQSGRREKKRRRQVTKEEEKEKVTKEKEKVEVPLIEISDGENEEADVFGRRWASDICDGCGSSVRKIHFPPQQIFHSISDSLQEIPRRPIVCEAFRSVVSSEYDNDTYLVSSYDMKIILVSGAEEPSTVLGR